MLPTPVGQKVLKYTMIPFTSLSPPYKSEKLRWKMITVPGLLDLGIHQFLPSIPILQLMVDSLDATFQRRIINVRVPLRHAENHFNF